MTSPARIVIGLSGLLDVSTEELGWVREFLRPWNWAVPRAKIGWSPERRWIVLSFGPTGNVEQALELIGNAVIASVQVPTGGDLETFVMEAEPADLRSKGDFAARPKTYHSGSTLFTDAEAEMLLAEHDQNEIGRRDVPLRTLGRDNDPRFRPAPALRSARTLDRPIVPLLNALFACGCQSYASCAGHLNVTDGTRALTDSDPYVMLDASARAAAVARKVAASFDAWQVQIGPRMRGTSLVLRLGDGLSDGKRLRPRTVDERRALDRRLFDAALALDPTFFSGVSMDEPCEEHRLLARIGVRSAVDWVDVLPREMVREHTLKDPIVSDQGVRVAPLASINVIGPIGNYELRLMNYDVAGHQLDARVVGESFADLRAAVEGVLASS